MEQKIIDGEVTDDIEKKVIQAKNLEPYYEC